MAKKSAIEKNKSRLKKVEKFKSRLHEQESDSKAATKMAVNRLENAVKLEGEKLRVRSQAQIKSQEIAK